MIDAQTVSGLLRELDEGHPAALDRLIPLVYDELRRIANGQLRAERSNHTLQPTALVHELYSRMTAGQNPSFQNRAHFLAVAARMMRKILIDHARAHKAAKRGGGVEEFALDELRDFCPERPWILIALDEALGKLQEWGDREAQVIEMRYFGGMSLEEIAEASGLTVAVVRRHLRVGETWLRRQLGAK